MNRRAFFAVCSSIFLLIAMLGTNVLAAKSTTSVDPVADLISAINKSYAADDKGTALKAGKKAFELCQHTPDKVSPLCETATSTYGFLLTGMQKTGKAIDVYSALIDDLVKKGAASESLAIYYIHRARLYRIKDKFGDARKDYLAAADLAPKLPKLNHKIIGLLAIEFASMEHSESDLNKARNMLDAVVAAARSDNPDNPSRLASALLERARLEEEHKNFSKAKPFLKEAFDLVNDNKIAERGLDTSINEFYAMACEHTGQKDEAARLRTEDTNDQNKISVLEHPGFNPVPVFRKRPEYPMLARYNDLDGWVIVSVTIGKDGLIKNLNVVDSYPMGVFEKSTIAAAKSWKYHPTYIDGQPIVIPDQYIMFEYRMSS